MLLSLSLSLSLAMLSVYRRITLLITYAPSRVGGLRRACTFGVPRHAVSIFGKLRVSFLLNTINQKRTLGKNLYDLETLNDAAMLVTM